MRVTPEPIKAIKKNECFVFGSNESGMHGAGAALFAYEECGAFIGQGFGHMSNSFAIPTKDWSIKVLPLSTVQFYVGRFTDWVKLPQNSKWKFYVTKVGCGLAGFKIDQIAPLFKDCIGLENVYLPQEFIDVILSLKDKETIQKMDELVTNRDSVN